MRHQAHVRKFGRDSSARRALFRSLATALIRDESCETTVQKAKDLRPIVEKLITLGRTDSLHNRRQAYSYLLSKPVVQKLFNEVSPRYHAVPGGYTRIVRTRHRHGDAAEMAIIALREVTEKKPAKKAAAKKAPKAKKADAETTVVNEESSKSTES